MFPVLFRHGTKSIATHKPMGIFEAVLILLTTEISKPLLCFIIRYMQIQNIDHIWIMNRAFRHMFSTAVHMICWIWIQLVCVLSESLDELSEMVIPLFSPVENKSVDIPFWSEGPYGPEHVKVSLKIMSSTDFYIRLIIHSLVLEITSTLWFTL